MRSIVISAFALSLLFGFGGPSEALSLFGFGGPSDELKREAENECVRFVMEKMEDVDALETHVFDTYEKQGKVVVKVGHRIANWTKRDDDSYAIRLCVYDQKAGTVMLPGLFDTGQWSK